MICYLVDQRYKTAIRRIQRRVLSNYGARNNFVEEPNKHGFSIKDLKNLTRKRTASVENSKLLCFHIELKRKRASTKNTQVRKAFGDRIEKVNH